MSTDNPIGKMDQRIVFYTRTTSKNAMGEKTFSFTEGDTRWASVDVINPYSSNRVMSEGAESKEIRQTEMVKFTMRYYCSAANTMQIYWNYKYYDVNGVHHDPRKKYTAINATYKD